MYAHPNHIPQPPHSAGQTYKGRETDHVIFDYCAKSCPGFRTHIDPSQVPSPLEDSEADAEMWENVTYNTLPGSRPPKATTDFTAFDQGQYVFAV